MGIESEGEVSGTRKMTGEMLAAAFTEAATIAAAVVDEDVPVEFAEQLAAYIESGLEPCDHAVGVCSCTTATLLEDLRMWIDGLRRCRRCGGDPVVRSIIDPDREEFCRGCLHATFTPGVVPLQWDRDEPDE